MLAQMQNLTWSTFDIIKAVIIIAAMVAILILGLRYFGVQIPQIVWQVIGIVLVAFLCIVAIKILFSM